MDLGGYIVGQIRAFLRMKGGVLAGFALSEKFSEVLSSVTSMLSLVDWVASLSIATSNKLLLARGFQFFGATLPSCSCGKDLVVFIFLRRAVLGKTQSHRLPSSYADFPNLLHLGIRLGIRNDGAPKHFLRRVVCLPNILFSVCSEPVTISWA